MNRPADIVLKVLGLLNFVIAVGILLPIAFTSFPNTFQQLSSLPFAEVFVPGKLGFLLIHLVLISVSSGGVLLLMFGKGGKFTSPIIIVLVFLAIAAGIFNPYWLGYMNVLQNGLFLYVWGLNRRGGTSAT